MICICIYIYIIYAWIYAWTYITHTLSYLLKCFSTRASERCCSQKVY